MNLLWKHVRYHNINYIVIYTIIIYNNNNINNRSLTMKEKLKNTTFSLPVKSIENLKEAVKEGYAKSLNSAVREAVELYTAKVSKEALKKEMEAASRDPLFLKDTKELMDDFKTSDKETAELITDW
jgi:Arc/MetJ-type ribon-helix-helix transcriptional regulator